MATRPTDRPLRPRNRRELIAEAAGRAFSERGYHAVGMDDIAAAEGVTAAALYRHFPTKYALFVHCATRLADGLVASARRASCRRTAGRHARRHRPDDGREPGDRRHPPLGGPLPRARRPRALSPPSPG